jgi:ribosome-binding factor A
MHVDRIARINELLRREIGEYLFRIIKDDEFDLSAVTITHVITSRNLRTARVLVSIRDHQAEREQILSRLRAHRPDIQKQIGRNVIIKYTPRLEFQLDTSVEQGDKILDLLYRLDGEPEGADEIPGGAER